MMEETVSFSKTKSSKVKKDKLRKSLKAEKNSLNVDQANDKRLEMIIDKIEHRKSVRNRFKLLEDEKPSKGVLELENLRGYSDIT